METGVAGKNEKLDSIFGWIKGIIEAGEPGNIFIFYDAGKEGNFVAGVADKIRQELGDGKYCINLSLEKAKKVFDLEMPQISILERYSYSSQAGHEWERRLASYELADFLPVVEGQETYLRELELTMNDPVTKLFMRADTFGENGVPVSKLFEPLSGGGRNLYPVIDFNRPLWKLVRIIKELHLAHYKGECYIKGEGKNFTVSFLDVVRAINSWRVYRITSSGYVEPEYRDTQIGKLAQELTLAFANINYFTTEEMDKFLHAFVESKGKEGWEYAASKDSELRWEGDEFYRMIRFEFNFLAISHLLNMKESLHQTYKWRVIDSEFDAFIQGSLPRCNPHMLVDAQSPFWTGKLPLPPATENTESAYKTHWTE